MSEPMQPFPDESHNPPDDVEIDAITESSNEDDDSLRDVQDLTIASTNAVSQAYLYINVGTAQGAAATVDLYIYGDILTA